MLKERLLEVFKELGFDEYKEVNPLDITFSKDVFDLCAKNTCGNFGKNHGCPPLAGGEEEGKARVLKYKNGFLLCKIVSILSRNGFEKSMGVVANLNKQLRRSVRNEDILVLGAGPCTICERCSALDNKPCSFPEKTQYSMEGSGIDVVRMAIDNKMTYNAGRGKVGYFSLVLYNN